MNVKSNEKEEREDFNYGNKKTKEKIGAELIKDMELKDRINSVENLLIDTFSITNPSLRHKAELNPILSTILLDQLKGNYRYY